jgi:hypothetical protein
MNTRRFKMYPKVGRVMESPDALLFSGLVI